MRLLTSQFISGCLLFANCRRFLETSVAASCTQTEARCALRGMAEDVARHSHIVSALGDNKPSDHMEMIHDLLCTEEPDFFFMELFLRDKSTNNRRSTRRELPVLAAPNCLLSVLCKPPCLIKAQSQTAPHTLPLHTTPPFARLRVRAEGPPH